MTDNKIEENAENWVSPMRKLPSCDSDTIALVKSAYIYGAHSLDEEIKELKRKNIEYFQSMEYWQKRARRLEVRRIHQGEKNKELRDKLQMSWKNTQECKPEAVEQKKFGHRRLSKQVLCVYEDGECHVERYDHDCGCWRWANGHGLMFEPKMWRYIDIPEGGTK